MRGFAGGSMAILLAAALSLQAFALLCGCGDACAHKSFSAKRAASPQHACCAEKAPSGPVDTAAPAISRECPCAKAFHETVQAVQSSPNVDTSAAVAVVAVLSAQHEGVYASPAALPFESPPPIRALSLLNQSFRC